MSNSSPSPIAEYRDRRRGADDVVQLFVDHVEVRWKRSDSCGECSLPLLVMSPHFDRRCGTGDDFRLLFWPGVVLTAVAALGWFTVPLPMADYVGVCAGVAGVFCVCMGYSGGKSKATQWSFMNVMYTNTMLTFGADPPDIAAAEAFVAVLVQQIRSDSTLLIEDVSNPDGPPR